MTVTSAAPGMQPGFEFGPLQGGWRAQAPARLCPRKVQAPRGRRGQGAAVPSPGSARTPGVPGPGLGCVCVCVEGCLPTAHPHPLSLCPRALQFLTCPSPWAHFSNLLLPPPSHSSRSFCTPSGSSLVPRAPGAEARTLGHLLSSHHRVFGFDSLSIPKWENPDTALL